MQQRKRPGPIKKGTLQKYTNMIGTYRDRFFILEPGVLKYSEQEYGRVKEVINLKNATLDPEEGTLKFSIEDNLTNHRIYLKAGTLHEKMAWIKDIERARHMFEKEIVPNSQEAARNKPNAAARRNSDVRPARSRQERHEDTDTQSDEETQRLAPLDALAEHCLRSRKAVTEAASDVSYIQSRILEIAGSVRDQKFREDVKGLSLRLVQRLEAYQTLILRHLQSTELLIEAENAQRKTLEQSLKQLARENYVMRKQVDHFRQFVRRADGRQEGEEEIPGRKLIEEMLVAKQAAEAAQQEEMRRRDEFESTDEFFDARSDAEISPGESPEIPEEQAAAPEAVEPELPAEKALLAPKLVDGQIVHRTRLPMPRTDMKVSLWSILKDVIGRDLSKVALPVYFNEPTSFLQRLAEDFQYSFLLDRGATLPPGTSSCERLCWVAAFTISPYASAVGRTYKPFNPLLGETYEFQHRNFRFLAEQVGHHPPVTAYHCHNQNFEVSGYLVVNNTFTGKSITVSLPGSHTIRLPQTGDVFTLNRTKMLINNVIFGKLTLEMFGTVFIANWLTGDYAVLEYVRKGWWDYGEPNEVRGIIFDSAEQPRFRIGGYWTQEIWAEPVIGSEGRPASPNNPQTLQGKDEYTVKVDFDSIKSDPSRRQVMWTVEERPPWSHAYYEFGYMTMELNEITDMYDSKKSSSIAPTDSRYRPDQRFLESGDPLASNEDKRRLEEKQRAAARARGGSERNYQPTWFKKTYTPEELVGRDNIDVSFIYRGGYWEARDNKIPMKQCPDIF